MATAPADESVLARHAPPVPSDDDASGMLGPGTSAGADLVPPARGEPAPPISTPAPTSDPTPATTPDPSDDVVDTSQGVFMADYNAFIDDVASEVQGFIGVSVVDLESGMALASRSQRPDFDLEVASAYNSEMVKGKFRTIRALNLVDDLEDMLLTLSNQLHLIKILNAETFVYLAADKSQTNLGLLRANMNMVLRRHIL